MYRLAVLLTFLSLVVLPARASAQQPYWVDPMQEVHAEFTGQSGTVARFGDSITVSLAFFFPLRYTHKNVPPEATAALDWLRGYLQPEVWGWQSASTGSTGGTTTSWPLLVDQDPQLRNIDLWLQNLNPEMAVIMWGTNDLQAGTPVSAVAENLREVIRTVKDNGSVPILTAIPPRHDYEPQAEELAGVIRELALDESVPLVDYYSEILTRNPGDTWDGKLIYEQGSVYEVERLISGDGVHPSNPTAFRQDFGEEALDKNGYNLRNYLTLMTMVDVYNRVILPEPGDANLDGEVDELDASILAANWQGTGGATWAEGDFNGDGDVNDLDASILAANWPSAGGAAAPEPGTFALLAGIVVVGSVHWWRRKAA